MPRTPKATDGPAPKKRTRKVATESETSIKVTKAAGPAQTAKNQTAPAVVEIPAQSANGGSPVSHVLVEEQIRLRAYELYLRRGGVGGSPEQDWFQAVSEIYSELVA